MSQINPEDLVNSEELDFSEETELWNTYKLSDGSTLKVKLVLTGVRRIKKILSPDGNPSYIITSKNVVRSTNIPSKLKAKPKPQPDSYT